MSKPSKVNLAWNFFGWSKFVKQFFGGTQKLTPLLLWGGWIYKFFDPPLLAQ